MTSKDDLDRLEGEQRRRLTVSVKELEAMTRRVPARQANAVAEAAEASEPLAWRLVAADLSAWQGEWQRGW